MKKISSYPVIPRTACFIGCLMSAAVWLVPTAAGQGVQPDGLNWQSIGSNPGGNMSSGAATSATNAYFGTSTNQLYHYDGSTLTSNALGWNAFAATSAWNSTSILNIAIDNLGNLHVAGQKGSYAYHDGTQWHGIQLTTPGGSDGTRPLMRDGFWIDPATGTSYIAGWSNAPVMTDSSEVFRLTDDGFGGYTVQSLSTGYAGGASQTVGAIVGTGLDNIWIASSQGAPRHSTDGGNTWSSPITSSPFNPSRAYMIDGETIVYGNITGTTNVAIWDGNEDPTAIVALAEQPGHIANRLYATGTDSIWAFKQAAGTGAAGAELSFYDGEEWHSIAFGGQSEEYRFMFGVDGVVFVLPNGSNDIYMGIIPEPGTWALLMGGSVLGLSMLVRRRRSRA